MNKALYVDSVSSVAGAFISTSSVTAYIESTLVVRWSHGADGCGWRYVPVSYVLLSPLNGDGSPYAPPER